MAVRGVVFLKQGKGHRDNGSRINYGTYNISALINFGWAHIKQTKLVSTREMNIWITYFQKKHTKKTTIVETYKEIVYFITYRINKCQSCINSCKYWSKLEFLDKLKYNINWNRIGKETGEKKEYCLCYDIYYVSTKS